MNNTWVKLYRKTVENGILKDHLAWILFSWLLMVVDKDTGKRKIGRFMVADEISISPNSYYKILNRLEKKWKVITTQRTNEYTEVCIVNWRKYQLSRDEQTMPRQRTDNEQTISRESTGNERNTIQEIKNTRIQEMRDIENSLAYLQNLPQQDTDEFVKLFTCSKSQVSAKGLALYDYCKAKGKQYKDYKALMRNALRKDFGERKVVVAGEAEKYEIDENGIARLKDLKEGFKMEGIN
jgi:hypothetical protein